MSSWAAAVIRIKGSVGHSVLPLAGSSVPILIQRVVLQLRDNCRTIVDGYGNGPSFKRIFYCISNLAACTDVLLPVMFNGTFVLLICSTKCGCFYKVDFYGFVLFEMALKVGEGRVGGGELFPFCTFFVIILQPKLLYKRSKS